MTLQGAEAFAMGNKQVRLFLWLNLYRLSNRLVLEMKRLDIIVSEEHIEEWHTPQEQRMPSL
jgi:hypothetical protein